MNDKMKLKLAIILGVAVLLIVGAAVYRNRSFNETSPKKVVQEIVQKTAIMELTSPVFENNQRIPPKYTCDGEDINPSLRIRGTPKSAKSLVLIMDDPDAPAGTWLHWTVWNISPATNQIQENSVPQGAIQGTTSFGDVGYGGPCPPSGTHRYFFKLFALDVPLRLEAGASLKELEEAMDGHILDQAELVGLYSRD